MATQSNICFFNKYGFCKYLEKCKRYHENTICEKIKCEKRECPLRHPRVCRFYRDLGFCKFSEWCKFSHNDDKSREEKNEDVKSLRRDLKLLKTKLRRNAKKS